MKKCKSCERIIPQYGEFPGGICVDCYALTDEANRPITAQELARMWGGK
jgi:RNA polymerase subunit RPABC4/transcription elongation factor Spt4